MSYILSDLISSVQDDLKDTSFGSTRITRYLNYGQNLIFNTHMFKFCEKNYTGTVASAATTKTQQTDHQATIGGALIDPSDGNIIFKLDSDSYLPHREFFDQNPNAAAQTSGMPNCWTEYGGVMYFDRPTDKIYTFNQRYYRAPTAMSATTDVPDVPEAFRELLEFYASFRAEKYRGNHDIAATYLQQFEDGLEAMNLRFAAAVQVAPTTLRSQRIRVGE